MVAAEEGADALAWWLTRRAMWCAADDCSGHEFAASCGGFALCCVSDGSSGWEARPGIAAECSWGEEHDKGEEEEEEDCCCPLLLLLLVLLVLLLGEGSEADGKVAA